MKDCSWPGCKLEVEDWRWGCGKHWNLLPLPIRQSISAKVHGADWDALVWIRETFGAQERREYTPGRWETLVRMVRSRDEARARRRAVGKDKT